MTTAHISKYVSLSAVVLLTAVVAHGGKSARYEAVFSEASRLEGDKLSGWHEQPGSPRLDNTALLDAKRPLRWLQDRSLTPWRPVEQLAYIEFVGGDRLVGSIVDTVAGNETNALRVRTHLLVKPAAPLHDPGRTPRYLRVLPGRIERVVFRSPWRRRLQPGSAYLLNGRRLSFLHIRWKSESVVLLLKESTREVKISDIAEIHPRRIDPWEAYYQELAILSPDCRARMMRIETTGGLIATSSSLKFAATAYGSEIYRQRAVKHRERLNKNLAHIESKRAANQQKFKQAGERHAKQTAESEKQIQAARKAHRNNIAKEKQRFDRQRKADDDDATRQREKLNRELQIAERDMQKRLSKTPADQRNKQLNAFGAEQARLRKSRERTLASARVTLQAKRQKELDKSSSDQDARLKQSIEGQQRRIVRPKQQLDEATREWEGFLWYLESVRSQRAAAGGSNGNAGSWYHILQPVWSLDPLWVPFAKIHMRWSFAPQQVPLSRIRPTTALSPPLQPWFANRNSGKRLLHSGQSQYAWGFAVHAHSELSLPLPKYAKAFRSRVGLDSIVGTGGCARARVYVGSTSAKPAYESPLLIGSQKTVDSGRIALPVLPDSPGLLILQADPVNRGGPPGADPLNIRDKLDWLDPSLELDTASLRDQINRQLARTMTDAPGWRISSKPGGGYAWTSSLDATGTPGVRGFRRMLQAKAGPVKLQRKMKIETADKWLALHVSLRDGENASAGAVVLRVGEQQVRAQAVPIKQAWRNQPNPLLFAIDKYQGKTVTLELIQPAGGKPLHWKGVSTMAGLPPAYRLAEVIKAVGKSDMKITCELGEALMSTKIDRSEKLIALEINQRGGTVSFEPPQADNADAWKLANVRLGDKWTGGDKVFLATQPTFKKLSGLKTLVVTKSSGVSDAAIAKLRTAMPRLAITRTITRIPSHRHGGSVRVTLRNSTDKRIVILYVTPEHKLVYSRYFNPGQARESESNGGSRLEAHYLRKDYTSAQQYIFTLPLTIFHSSNGAVWNIRTPGQ
jgi:hypothetical protein